MMGQAAKVPIEPPTQTDLLDRTMAEKGVVFAGVPGAGGHDAIFVIILAPHQNKLIEIRRNVENAWNRNPAGPVKPIQIQLDSLGLKFE